MFKEILGVALITAPFVSCAAVQSIAGKPEAIDSTRRADEVVTSGEDGLGNTGLPVAHSFEDAFPVNTEICEI